MNSPRLSLVLLAPLLAAGLGCADGPAPTAPVIHPSEATGEAAAPLAFRQMSTGTTHTCGVTTDNRLFCWGSNNEGQLGDGTTIRRLVPVPVAGSRSYRQVSAGYDFTCALTTGDRAFCWGTNSGDGGGQLGDGTLVNRRLKPVAVLGGHAFRQVTAGLYHACAVKADDRAWCWGSGGYGQRGDGTLGVGREPIPVAGALRFRQVSAGYTHTCGVTTGDRAYCWGQNSDGEVGDSTQTTALRPVPVAGGRRFRQVDGGGRHSCGVTTDGGRSAGDRTSTGRSATGEPHRGASGRCGPSRAGCPSARWTGVASPAAGSRRPTWPTAGDSMRAAREGMVLRQVAIHPCGSGAGMPSRWSPQGASIAAAGPPHRGATAGAETSTAR